MLTVQTARDFNIFMMSERILESAYSITVIQQAMSHNLETILMIQHAVTGCGTVSALYNVGKRNAVYVNKVRKKWRVLDLFHKPSSNNEEVARVGEQILLKLYRTDQSTSRDILQYACTSMRQVGRKSVIATTVYSLCH